MMSEYLLLLFIIIIIIICFLFFFNFLLIALGTMFPKSVEITENYVGMVNCSDPSPWNSLAKVLRKSAEELQKGAKTEKLIRVDHSM